MKIQPQLCFINKSGKCHAVCIHYFTTNMPSTVTSVSEQEPVICSISQNILDSHS